MKRQRGDIKIIRTKTRTKTITCLFQNSIFPINFNKQERLANNNIIQTKKGKRLREKKWYNLKV